MAHSAVDIDTMDAGMPDGVPDFPEPKPQEAMFFFNIIKNMANQPDIDWDAVAADSGFKNAAVAKVPLVLVVLPSPSLLFSC